MFCYTYSSVLPFVDSFYQFLYCFMHPLHGAAAHVPLHTLYAAAGFLLQFFRKTFSDFPKPYAEYFHLFAHKQTRKSVIREAKCAHEKKHKPCCKKYKPYISKYKAHILKQVPCIFCLSKCLKNNMVQKPPNRASARRKSAVGK